MYVINYITKYFKFITIYYTIQFIIQFNKLLHNIVIYIISMIPIFLQNSLNFQIF